MIDETLVAGDGEIPEKELAKYAVPDGPYWRWLTEAQGVRRVAEEHRLYYGLTTLATSVNHDVPAGTSRWLGPEVVHRSRANLLQPKPTPVTIAVRTAPDNEVPAVPIPLRRRTATAISAGLIALALAACDPPDPGPPPPTPSITTPASSASPSPTMTIQERDYAAAAEAFRNANRVIDEALGQGDGGVPKELEEYVVPDRAFWETETGWIDRYAEAGTRLVGESKVILISPVKDYTPNQVSMYACVDGREVETILKDGTREMNGILVAGTLTFRKAEGRWRVFGYETDTSGKLLSFQRVTECEAP